MLGGKLDKSCDKFVYLASWLLELKKLGEIESFVKAASNVEDKAKQQKQRKKVTDKKPSKVASAAAGKVRQNMWGVFKIL